jgi:hypothetical protein
MLNDHILDISDEIKYVPALISSALPLFFIVDSRKYKIIHVDHIIFLLFGTVL